MALSEEAIVQQINALTTKTSENPEMVYKAVAAINKGLDPKFFSGNDSKIVNAINKLANEVEVLTKAFVQLAEKSNSILMDIHSEENAEIWEETKELMETENIIEGIKAILEGYRQDKILQLDPIDVGKILSVSTNEFGEAEVKPVSIESFNVEVSSYDVAYLNRDYKGITSVGEAIDLILDDMQQPLQWDELVNVPNMADDLVIEGDSLVLKSTVDDDLANVPITNDADIDSIINSLDV